MKRTVGLILSGSLLLGAGACTAASDGGGDDDGMVGDDDGGGGGGGGGWTAMPLLDTRDPDDFPVYHAGNDHVSGIYFAGLDDGYVTTEGDHESAQKGGAVFKATSDEVTSIAYDGFEPGPSLLGTVDFHGIEPTSDGYIALAYAGDTIASHDGGETFSVVANGGDMGIGGVLAYHQGASGFTMVRDGGVVTLVSGTPGPSATFTDIWAPEAFPSIPSTVPADQCQTGPGTGEPKNRANVSINGGGTIAYTALEEAGATICVSTDGGHSFFPHALGVTGDGNDARPFGVQFVDDDVALAWWGSPYSDTPAYLRRSTDGGTTWAAVALPDGIASHAVELRAAFFAPDAQHGWMVGYDYTASGPVLIKTTDAGATWSTSGAGLATATANAAGAAKLWTGFALDNDHIWVGGDFGILLSNDHGGD